MLVAEKVVRRAISFCLLLPFGFAILNEGEGGGVFSFISFREEECSRLLGEGEAFPSLRRSSRSRRGIVYTFLGKRGGREGLPRMEDI